MIEIEFDEIAIEPKPALLMSMSISSSRFCLFKELRAGVRVSKIECEVLRANAGQTSELVAERDELVFGASDEENVSPAGGEFSGKGRSDAGRCSVMRVVFI